jgi:two-component system, sensor histidine kinase and response regulator
MKTTIDQFGQKLTGSDYDALLSSLNQTALVSMTNKFGDIIYANQKFVEVSKYKLSELIGQNHRILKSWDQPEELFVDLWKTISSGNVWRGEIKNKAKDGTFYWVDTSIAPILGEDNKPERYISVRILITDKKNREQQLEETKAKDEAILASIGDGIVASDIEGNVLLINNKAQELLGCQGVEVIGKPLIKVFNIKDKNGQDVPLDQRPLQRAIKTRKPFSPTKPYYVTQKDGTTFPVAITVAPIMIGYKFIGTIDVFRDITREQNIEKAKDEFISIASHQLRTPATAVKQYVGMLLADFAGEPSDEQRNLLQAAYDSNERQIHIVDDLLKVARVDSGQIKLKKQPTDIIAMIQTIVNDQYKQAKEKDQTITFQHPSSEIVLEIDADHIHMVLENILENAIKYTPVKKSITIKVTKNKRSLSINVTDEGIGMRSEDIDKIFEKFTRLEGRKAMTADGSGLGLYWADRIVRLHNGRIDVKTSKGSGSTFTVYLPMPFYSPFERSFRNKTSSSSNHNSQINKGG